MADPIAVANAFVTHYNSLFDSPDRTSLAPLYVSHRSPAPSRLRRLTEGCWRVLVLGSGWRSKIRRC